MTEPKSAAVTDLEDWVEANAEIFESVARASGTARELVHLAAVFVKSGLTDEQILAECEALVPRFGSSQPVEAGLQRALPLLRAALDGPAHPAGHDR
ncbi:MAG TPA: hypothetical protein VNF71_01870 [Acidimicrobiales bacterium]|nr:hypothetical protein [Acidimicrobiales bacterium]